MTYFVITEKGELVTKHGSPRRLDPAGWLTPPEYTGAIHPWVGLAGEEPNTIGTVLLVALSYERRPYCGPVIFAGRYGEELTPVAEDAIKALHLAIRCALSGLASGWGAEFDQQAISTAQMAEGP